MTDSIDKKSKEKRDNFDVDLDAMLDEAESSLVPMHEFDGDEDAIDRLLMNAGFDADDVFIQAEVNRNAPIVKDVDLHDELDDFLSFEGFGATLNELEETQAAEVEKLEQTVGNSSLTPLNEAQDDEDALDRLLMNADLDADDALLGQASVEDTNALEELDDFSHFSDFNEPEIVPSVEVEEPEQATENSSAVDEAGLADGVDDFFGLSDEFDESDLIQDDELVAPVPAAVDLSESAVVEVSDVEDQAGALEEPDGFSDFSDFNEPEIVPSVEVEAIEPATENSSVVDDEAGQDNSVDDFFGLSDEFDESDLIQDDELEIPVPATVDLSESAVAEASDVEDQAGAPEELDGFSDFGANFSEPEIVPSGEVEETEPAAENSAAVDEVGLDEGADDFFGLSDEFDEADLIQNDELETPVPAAVDLSESAVAEASDVEDQAGAPEELDGFSDFSDFSEPEIVPSGEVEETEPAAENSAAVDEVGLDEGADDFFGLSDEFDEADLIQNDELETPVPAAVDLSESAVAEASDVEDQAGAPEELDGFSDFSDFNEPEIVPSVEAEAIEPAAENSAAVDEVGLDEGADDFFGLSDEFDEADLIQNDELETPVPAAVDLSESAVAEASDVEDQAGAPEELDVFSDFSDFNEPEIVPSVEAEAIEPAAENSAAVDEVGLDEGADDFFGLSDEFDESDLIQDDEVETPADLNAPNEVRQEVAKLSTDDQDAADAAPQDDEDDFSGFIDDFDESDLIQDDEVETSAGLTVDKEGQQAIVEESVNDLQDDENSFDSQFTDAGFDVEDALEQTVEMDDEFGDDADLSKIDNFFQVDEGSYDFSKQIEEAQLEETEKASVEDDFLLPDFDITADSEISVTGIKDDEFADAFSDTDFLNEADAVQALGAEVAELKSGENEAVADPQSEQVTDTTVEEIEDVKLSPFGFEHEDMKKQLEEAENKVKKTKLFSYVALGFGAVAISAAAGLGVMTYEAKTEISKLTKTVSTLEASLAKSVAGNPSDEINAMRNSVVQLNQQVDGFITELKGNPQFPVDLLNNNVPDIVAKQDTVSKALDILQGKMGGLDEKAPLEPSAAEQPKVEVKHESVPVKESNTHEIAPFKSEIGREHAPTKERVVHELAPPKEGGSTHEYEPAKKITTQGTAPAKVEAVPESPSANKVKVPAEPVTAKPITPVTPAKAVAKEEEPVSIRNQEVTGKWGVNLVAVKQEWYAKSKAAEFARQGVYVEVIPVQGNNAMMYRLRAGGFKSKAEANANAARIKKALNLDNVWVSDN